MTTLVSHNCIEIIDNLLNRQETARQALRDAEARYEAARQYMMADPSAENALELHRERMQVRSLTEGLADIERSLDHALLRDFYTL